VNSRSIGIDIGADCVRAVQVARTRRGLVVERAYAAAATSPDVVVHVLRELTARHGFSRRARIAVAMPHGAVCFRAVHTDIHAWQQARQAVRFQIEDDVPVPFDELVVDLCGPVSDDGDVLAAAISRTDLRCRLKAIADAGLPCHLVDAIPCALLAAVGSDAQNDDPPGMLVHVDGSSAMIAATQAGRLVNARAVRLPEDGAAAASAQAGRRPLRSHVPCHGRPRGAAPAEDGAAAVLAREIDLTWHTAFGRAMTDESLIAVSGDDRLAAGLAVELQRGVAVADYRPEIVWPADAGRDQQYAVAVGLAVRALVAAEHGVNFLAAENAAEPRAADVRYHAIAAGVLAGAIAAVWCAGVFLRLGRMEHEYQRLKHDARQVFEQTLPGEKPVNELPQLEERVAAMRKQHAELAAIAGTGADGISPLDVLHRISAAVPDAGGMRISEMSVTGRTVRLAGTVGSFRAVDELKARLQTSGEFESVAIHDVAADRSTGAVRFTLALTVAPG